MPLHSTNREDLEREYGHAQLSTLEIQKADACYAFGHDSEEEEEFRIKIYKLYLEFSEKIGSSTNKKNQKAEEAEAEEEAEEEVEEKVK